MKKIIFFTLIALPFILGAQDIKESKHAKHNFALDLGYGRRLASEPSEIMSNQMSSENHFNSLENGFEIKFAYDYMFEKNMGIGFIASAFNSSKELKGDSLGSKDDIYMYYIAPSFKYVFPTFSEKYNIYVRGSIGLINFRNSSTVPGFIPKLDSVGQPIFDTATHKPIGTHMGFPSIIKGYTLGYSIETGIDYSINDFLSIGFNIGFTGGLPLKNLDVNDNRQTLIRKEDLHRLEFNIGARIKL